ncbi:MAG: hypothetical protein Q4C04_06640 [Clostridia bacterium]|nr:hypothetical protein [Clostridia bacterium]
MELSLQQQKEIGFAYIMERLQPDSPYGRQAKKELRPFSREENWELELAIEDIRLMREAVLKEEAQFARISVELGHFFWIQSSVKRIADGTAGEVDFFELKRYLLSWNALAVMLRRYSPLDGLFTESLNEPLALLDPANTGTPTFAYSSDKLERIRFEKARAQGGRRLMLAAEEEREERAEQNRLCKSLSPHMEAVFKSMKAIARFDMALCKARLALQDGAVLPEFGEGGLRFAEMINPKVSAEIAPRRFHPITIELNIGSAVITGANMGGKSVTLSTLALNVYLAHCGLAVYAKEARLPLLDGLYLLGDTGREAQAGLSSFAKEVGALKRVMEAADGERLSLILLDEPARGTNPHEGALIARGLCRYGNNSGDFYLIATHYDGVAEEARTSYQIAGLKPLDIDGGRFGAEAIAMNMDYSLLKIEGDTQVPRDAQRIMRLMGVSAELLRLIES